MDKKTDTVVKALRHFTKAEVKYSSHGLPEEHCSICTHYANRTTCKIVEGPIVPGGWCNKFKIHSSMDRATYQ